MVLISLGLEMVMYIKYPQYSIAGKVRRGKTPGYPSPSKEYTMFDDSDSSDDNNVQDLEEGSNHQKSNTNSGDKEKKLRKAEEKFVDKLRAPAGKKEKRKKPQKSRRVSDLIHRSDLILFSRGLEENSLKY